jgi:hypothetical protein
VLKQATHCENQKVSSSGTASLVVPIEADALGKTDDHFPIVSGFAWHRERRTADPDLPVHVVWVPSFSASAEAGKTTPAC